MPKHKKKFIDKKRDRTTTFALVHRSQRDPLAADSEAPQRILQEIGAAEAAAARRKEEERSFGIFYEDEYNYLQHVKDREAPELDYSQFDRFVLEKDAKIGALGLPPEVFATPGPEEDVGLLNRAAPQSGPLIDWDPDIVETLDDDYDHEAVYTAKDEEDGEEEEADELDDIFKDALAEGEEDEESFSGSESFDSDFGGDGASEAEDSVPELKLFADEETKSRFTHYSLSSSVIRRNEQLALLDDRFESFYAEYDEINLGALDCDDIEGHLEAAVAEEERPENRVMSQILDDYRADKESERRPLPDSRGIAFGIPDEKPDLEFREDDDEQGFDCRSILSTYSNLYNRPGLISERSSRPVEAIEISRKTGMPKGALGKGLTARVLKQLDRETASDPESDDDDGLASRVSALSFRNKHETAEEKRARKGALKDLKRERRIEKKANKSAFRQEQCRQEKSAMHRQQQHQPGIKIV